MQDLWTVQYCWLIPLLPLIAAAIAGFLGARILRQQSHWPIWLGVGASAVLSLILLFQTVGLSRRHEAPAQSREAASAAHEEGAAGETPLGASKDIYTWIAAGDPQSANQPDKPQQVFGNSSAYFEAKVGFFIDPLTVVMLCVVTCIGWLIAVFSAGYMHGERGYWRFFAYLGLFIFMMTCLVMGNNLIMLYLGWEGVGLCSYLLIGYYYEKPSAAAAAKKAFIVNRVGDFGFGIGIILSFLAFGTISFFGQSVGSHTGLLELAASPNLSAFQRQAIYWIPFCLMLGAFGKSAQFPLYVWLPDAMEGPTPVSALIHAATMVTAGVYMIARCGPLFVQNPTAMTTVAAVGTFTALLAATIALRQFDLKKVFAYSTISQLGYMFVAVGALAPVAGVFHLVTHAFFKALLFLACGVVMHAMAGELDMRKMSGLKRILPATNIVMLIGCAALSGFPFVTSGFYSKDEIIGAAFTKHPIFGALLLLAAFMTAYYTFRLYFRVFQGPLVVPGEPAPAHAHGHEMHEEAAASESAIETGTAPASGVDVGQATGASAHDEHGKHNHEPMLMIVPLIVLAIGAIGAGFLNFPGEWFGEFLGRSPSFQQTYHLAHVLNAEPKLAGFYGQPEATAPSHNWALMGISGAIALLGIFLAYVMHLRDRALADRVARGLGPITWSVEAKFWVDEIYNGLFVAPLNLLGKFFSYIVDGWIVNGLVWAVANISWAWGFFLKAVFQRGFLQGYAAAMLLGVAIILLVIFLR